LHDEREMSRLAEEEERKRERRGRPASLGRKGLPTTVAGMASESSLDGRRGHRLRQTPALAA
jgi:hypothetical protein